MKSLSIVFSVLFISIFSMSSFAQKSETVKVWGNCGMCKTTIETAAKKGGATAADWNKDSKVLTVEMAEGTDLTKIQKAVAAAGYDTRDFAGNDEAYSKLPGCCHYDRKAKATATAKEAAKTPAVAGDKHADCPKDGCKDMDCSKKKAECCKDKTADCCKDGKCDKAKMQGKDKEKCKDKNCCKS